MTELAYWEARARAVNRAMDANPDIVMLGGYFTAPFNPADGVVESHPDQVLWPPTSEMAVMGAAVGAAITGLRPLVATGTASFVFYGWPQLVSEAPNVRYLSGGTATAPVVVHMFAGVRRAGGAQHEHHPQSMLQNVPGLHLFAPATPADVDGLFDAALTGDDPVVVIDHMLLAEVRGDVPASPRADVGRAALLRSGSDVVIVSYSAMVHRALEAAERLAGLGLDASVLNLRTIVPLPVDDVRETVANHPAALFVDESRLAGSPTATLVAELAQARVTTPIGLACTRAAPSPFTPSLVDALVPTVELIVEEAMRLTGAG